MFKKLKKKKFILLHSPLPFLFLAHLLWTATFTELVVALSDSQLLSNPLTLANQLTVKKKPTIKKTLIKPIDKKSKHKKRPASESPNDFPEPPRRNQGLRLPTQQTTSPSNESPNPEEFEVRFWIFSIIFQISKFYDVRLETSCKIAL